MEQIKNRFTGEIMCEGLSLEVVIERHKKWLLGEEGGKRANLYGADLSEANLSEANLSEADLSDANLRIFKHDIWAVLMYAPHEVENLVNAIKEGKIDGSCYEGECCCLCGTLEKGLNFQIDIRDAGSPAEQWFSMINPGDTPENNQASKMALEWIEEWQGLMGKEESEDA